MAAVRMADLPATGTDVLVVGAGPTGLMAGLVLTRRGVPVVVAWGCTRWVRRVQSARDDASPRRRIRRERRMQVAKSAPLREITR